MMMLRDFQMLLCRISRKLMGFLFVLWVSVPASVNAQKLLDQAYLKCQYDYLFEEDTLSHRVDKDRLILLVGKNISKCYSYYSMQIDTIFASPNSDEILHQQISSAINAKTEWPHKKMKAYIYKNYPEGIMTVTDGLLLQDYIYQDTLNAQNWEILDATKEILGHECQQATCDFRGHHWTAWFATDVPVSDGPWKFGGLPGLIMEVSAENENHVFRLVGIEKVADEGKKAKEPIVFSKTYVGNNKFEKTTLEKFLREQRKFVFGDDAIRVQQETGIELPNASSPSSNKKKRQYKPLEVL